MSGNYRTHALQNVAKEAPKFLYLGATLRSLGYNLLGGFGMIYLFRIFIDYGLPERDAFILMMIRQGLVYLMKLALVFPTAKLVKKLGARTLIVIGPALSALATVLWALAAGSLWWLVPDLLVRAVMINVYWIPFHSIFSVKNDKNSIGKQMGTLNIISSVISIVSPLLAAIVIENFGGFNILFAASFLVFALSSIALSRVEVNLGVNEFSIKDLRKALKKEGRLVPDYVVIGAENIVQDVVWCIFVFLFVKSFFKLGVLTSTISLTLAIFSYAIGKLSDEKKVGGIDKFGAVFNGIIWIGKLFVQNGLHVFFLDSLFGLFRTSYSVPIDVIVYSDAKHDNPMWPVIIREVALDIGRTIMSFVAAFIIYQNWNYWVIFLFASLGYLLLGLLLKDNQPENNSRIENL